MTKTINALVQILEIDRSSLGDAEAWMQVRGIVTAALAQARAEQAEPVAVAFLDIGAGGYVDLGSDLTYGQLAELPFGRHALAIVGTFGVDGYAPTTPPAAPVAKLEPLTEEEIDAIYDDVKGRGWALDFARAIEAAHNAKLGGAR